MGSQKVNSLSEPPFNFSFKMMVNLLSINTIMLRDIPQTSVGIHVFYHICFHRHFSIFMLLK